MVATRLLKPAGSKSRQSPRQVQPPDNIENSSASRRCINLGTNYSFYYPECCQNFRIRITSYIEDCLMYCPFTKVIKSDSKSFLANIIYLLEGNTTASYATFYKQWNRPMSKRSISRATLTDLACCRLPTASNLSNKAAKSRSDQF